MCEGCIDKKVRYIDDEASLKHLTNGEPRKIYSEGGYLINLNDDAYFCKSYNKCDLCKITKQIRNKKFIREAPIGSDKSPAKRRYISAHKDNKFMVIVPIVNIAEEFYTKLTLIIDDKSIRFCVKDDASKEFGKAVNDEVNIVITTYCTVSKCLGDLIEEYYEREPLIDFFIEIDEAHLLLNHISLIEITKEFDKGALIIATADVFNYFDSFKDYIIINPRIDD